MKKNLNVIQIKGTRGLLCVVGFVCCLIAGFICFPGYVAMHLWNLISNNFMPIPAIGIIQGILLWGIIVASYFLFRKEKLVVCMRSTDEGLSEDELRQVFAKLKKQADNDTLIQSMLRAKETELKIKNLKESGIVDNKKISTAEENEKLKIK